MAKLAWYFVTDNMELSPEVNFESVAYLLPDLVEVEGMHYPLVYLNQKGYPIVVKAPAGSEGECV